MRSWKEGIAGALVFVGNVDVCDAIMATGVLSVKGRSLSNGSVDKEYSVFGSQASFGVVPAMGEGVGPGSGRAMLPPEGDELLCGSYEGAEKGAGGVMVVGRGGCTFERKALAAEQLGAVGIVIYGTLSSRYGFNDTTQQVLWPQDKLDYDCSHGQATLSDNELALLTLPYSSTNDQLLSGASQQNLCVKNNKHFADSCASQRCLLTGDQQQNTACCAWDLHLWLYSDPSLHSENSNANVNIPALYITMQQGHQLLQDIQDDRTSLMLQIHSRPRPAYNISAILIWALGVFVAALAAKLSADEYNPKTLTQPMQHIHTNDTANDTPPLSSARSRSRSPSSHSAHRQSQQQHHQRQQERTYVQPQQSDLSNQSDSLELTPAHAFAFIIMASSALLILFFLKVYNFVKVMYAFGCSGALTQVFFYPLYTKLFANNASRKHYMNQVCTNIPICEIGKVTRIELLSAISGYALGLAWLLVAFLTHHPENNLFFWITQDLMGACMCILFLSIIKLNSIRVASILLIVAFLYDIFFVFITPLIFKGQSVMITVATSGGPPKADPSWCEKYPTDNDCQGGDPLPMLLTVPRIGDYQGGASLLGLGDIVLPGLLLSFAARLDQAKKLLGYMRGGAASLNRSPHTCPSDSTTATLCRPICNKGYFIPLVIAYAIGLLMANLAVYLMNMGQPALLYLVPACLGTMLFLGKRRNELDELWHGPKVIRAADAMIYGEDQLDAEDADIASVGSGSVTAPTGSIEDGPGGDVPLLSLT